ncbi:MAG: MotA/TolQ/ExbB proton channel family protein [Candidatus Margulisbacteria bacterium]|nr:MotA/TolQ/ExbB proton channel family protein [Candidatus Margulisiibacteriota bacterium]
MNQKNKSFYNSYPDPTTILGVIAGILVLLMAIGLDRGLKFFIQKEAIVIVFGGTLAASLVHFPLTQIFKMLGRLKVIFLTRKAVPERVIDQLVEISQTIKAEGKMAIVKDLDNISDPFLKHGIQLIADKVPTEQVSELLRDEIQATINRHYLGQVYFDVMAKYAPGFGLLGTLIGLIMLLQNLKEPETIGPNMGMAMVATFYGVLLANLVFTPLAGRLEILSDEEAMVKEMILVGIIAISREDAPLIVKEKMLIYLSRAERKKYDRTKKK